MLRKTVIVVIIFNPHNIPISSNFTTKEAKL